MDPVDPNAPPPEAPPPETPPQPSLVIVASGDPEELGRRYPLDPKKPIVMIGRRPGNDIVLSDMEVQFWHAEVVFRRGAWSARDSSGASATRVNGQTIDQRVLATGDRIEVGGVVIEFDDGTPRAAPRDDDR